MKNTMYGEPDQKVLKQTEPGCPWASSAVTSPSTTVPAARRSSARAHLRKFLGLQFAEFVWRTASRRKPSSLISYVMPDIMWRRDAVLASNVHGRFADAT
jgi:hypothetical protein